MERMPTFEEVATAHIKALRAMQPEGPYLLGGFCNGALLAYEMARQLQASGQRVALLALITPSSIYTYRALAMLVRWLGRLGLNEEEQAHCFLRLRHALRHIYRSLWTADHRLLDFNKLTALDTRLKKMFPVLEALYNDYVGVFAWLSTGYRPACYPDKIMFYWAQDEPCIREEWHRMAITSREQEEGYMLPGTHMTCVTQYTQVLAEHLRKQLQQIQRDLQE
jgi:thioesterase domain-containing protein